MALFRFGRARSTEKRELETYWLNCHPDTPARTVTAILVESEVANGALWLRYHVDCDLEQLALSAPCEAQRADGLWQTTCFELFVGGSPYAEFNFSPSGQWAAYAFDGYRDGMRILDMPQPPELGNDASECHFALEATLPIRDLSGALGLSAVIEERDGTKSYWALAHPPGAPDFHHPTCFAATLAAPDAP